MAYISDAIDISNKYGISQTAAGLFVKLRSLMWSSQRNDIHDRDGCYVYASRAALAAKIGRSERTVLRAMRELKEAGLIVVKRTRHNSHIYFCGGDVTSRHDNNVTSNNKTTSITRDTSIYLAKVQKISNRHSMIDESSATISATAGEKMQEIKCGTASTASKGRPTPKRQRMPKQQKQAARMKYLEILGRRLKLAPSDRHAAYGEREEYEAANNLALLIADAVAGRSYIAVNGTKITPQDYWHVVQSLSNEGLFDLIERIETARITTGIRNLRAYTLAAVYNHAIYHSLTLPLDNVV